MESNSKPIAVKRTSVPPPPPRKIVYVNPSQEFYLGRKNDQQKHQSLETEEYEDRESNELTHPSYFDDQPDYQQQTGYKDDPVVSSSNRQTLKNDLFVKHDEMLENNDRHVRKQLFTPNQPTESYESDEDEYFEYDTSTTLQDKPIENDDIIPRSSRKSFTLTPQSSRRVNTVKSLDNFRARSHDWKHDILEEMRVSLTNCCIQCKTQTLMHLEKTLQLIHRYLTRELDEHYAEITSSLRTTGRRMEHIFPGLNDEVRDNIGVRSQIQRPDSDKTQMSDSDNKPNHQQIVQVQLNDNLSDNFKKIVFQVTKTDPKSKRKVSGALNKLKSIRNEAINQRQKSKAEHIN